MNQMDRCRNLPSVTGYPTLPRMIREEPIESGVILDHRSLIENRTDLFTGMECHFPNALKDEIHERF